MKIGKTDISLEALWAIALETIHNHYPSEHWLHVYPDGSLSDFSQGAGIFCELFRFYLSVGNFTTDFGGEL